MVSKKDVIKLPLETTDIFMAIDLALKHDFIDNLRNRSKAVQLDCKIRGYIGEIGLRKWFAGYDIFFEKANYLPDGVHLDVDLAYKGKERNYNLEIKTSLIPDNFADLNNSLSKCDIKLLKRNETIQQLKGDIHIQIFFNFYRKKRDEWLKKLSLETKQPNIIFEKLGLENYKNRTFLVAWIDKPTLIKQIESLQPNKQTWTFPGAQKEFWNCNIAKQARIPFEMVDYLKKL